MAIKLSVSGCCGRMGTRIASLSLSDGMFALAGVLESSGHQMVGRPFGSWVGRPDIALKVSDDAKTIFSLGDVVIEFTTPEATIAHVQVAQELGKPMVIGTTGLSPAQQDGLRTASRKIPIVWSPNMSVGVNVLFELAQLAAQRLGPSYDVEVVEAHHRQKRDAPSGTAKRLAELLAAVRRQSAESLPVHAVRAGDIVGDHTVIFAGPSERLELTHRAQDRDVFAQGALNAARFIVTQRPGLYDMPDVLKGRTW